MTEPSNSNNGFSNGVFLWPEMAQDFLCRYLPEEVASLLAPTVPWLRKESFVDEVLQEYFSDLLYEVQLHDGRDAYIYILMEHKSCSEPLIARGLLRCLVRIWEYDLQQAAPSHLVPILPVVVRGGRAAWQTPCLTGSPWIWTWCNPTGKHWFIHSWIPYLTWMRSAGGMPS